MGSRHLEPVLKGFETLYRAGPTGARADSELIEAFLTRGDSSEAAFAALVERHGPMVLRVCRGELRDAHRAEDAFQATFLILARKAGSIRKAGSVASWLYGVARRVARRARLDERKRAERERRGAVMANEDGPGREGSSGLFPEILEEIDRLPEKDRSAVVLCDLEGLSRDEAALRLGVPAATLRVRLARARQRLRARLVRRGLAPVAVVAALAGDAAAMPAPLVDQTVRAAMLVAAGRAAGASGPVAALVEGVLRAMFLAKLKFAAVLATALVAASLAAIPLLGAIPGPTPPDDPAPGAEKAEKVVVATVASEDVARTTNQVASVTPFQSIEVYAKVSGVLEAVEVDVGDPVKRNQVVAIMQAPELRSDVEQAKARLEQAKARLLLAKTGLVAAEATEKTDAALVDAARSGLKAAEAQSEYRQKQAERIKGLVQRHAVEERLLDEALDKQEEARANASLAKGKLLATEAGQVEHVARVDQSKADVAAAEADVRAAEAALDRARLLADQATIRSPIDGVVSRRSLSTGDFARSGDQPGAQPILTVVRADIVRVVVHVPDSQATHLAKGTLAAVRLDSVPGRVFDGKVARMDYDVSPVRTIRTEIDIDNRDGLIRPGMRGQASIDLEPRRARLVIPVSSIYGVGAGKTADCFRVEGGRLALTRIKFEDIGDGRAAAVEGLKAGDRVVVSPVPGMKDGQAVEVEAGTP